MNYKYIILGGTGHIGTALAKALEDRGERVLAAGHDEVDVFDTRSLSGFFGQGERAFILNPPAPPDADTLEQETKSIQSIIAAVKNSSLEKIVAASTYGAQAGNNIGDLGVLYEMEQGLKAQQVPLAIIRSAYYMSNFDQSLKVVRETGNLPSLYPADFELPMVAPADIGLFAAELMGNGQTGLFHIEGPKRYTIQDVANAFSQALNKPVNVAVTPEADWEKSLSQSGFSEKAAASFVNMTRLTLYGPSEDVNQAHLGSTGLETYIENLVKRPDA
ncbi:sugar nucleotide-binding protein [Mucilaginibacter corticis]|uniref:Sugar nucleotide-binding protein n=2 Tax=Mucilaginibacter corticis TaxID=2597670 RepID=A0A556M4U4_9SPHI|nr:sugar nucleotide-binding protein [Mucilaginibacter corticis]